MKILSLCMRFALFLSCARDMIMDLVKQKYHRKCTENIMENMDTDITIETRY